MQSQAIVLIPLYARDGSGRVIARATIDAIDFPWVNQWRWGIDRCGDKEYVSRWDEVERRNVRLHRALLGLKHGDRRIGDHISRNTFDCRRENLRIISKGQNGHNQRAQAGRSSVYRGVSWDKIRQSWRAYVKVGGKTVSLGRFGDEVAARDAAARARAKHLIAAID